MYVCIYTCKYIGLICMYILISILIEDWVWVSKNLRTHVQKRAKKEERKRESDWRDDRKTRARDRLGAAIDP